MSPTRHKRTTSYDPESTEYSTPYSTPRGLTENEKLSHHVVDKIITNKTFHSYLYNGKSMSRSAYSVHNINNFFFKKETKFSYDYQKFCFFFKIL